MVLNLERDTRKILQTHSLSDRDRQLLESVHSTLTTHIQEMGYELLPLADEFDLSNIPMNVDSVDSDSDDLVRFITSIDVPIQLQNALVNYSFDPPEMFGPNPEEHPLKTIRHLYNLTYNGPINYIHRIGEKSAALLRQRLEDVMKTGIFPDIDPNIQNKHLQHLQESRTICLRIRAERQQYKSSTE